jgi:membrane protein
VSAFALHLLIKRKVYGAYFGLREHELLVGISVRVTAAWVLIRETFKEWKNDEGPRLGAALAYYAVFSIPPFLLILISGLGLIYKGDAAGWIERELVSLVNKDVAHAMLQVAPRNKTSSGILAACLGFGLLLFGASGLFSELKNALNTIWKVESTVKPGIIAMIKAQFLSFTTVIGTSFLLLVSLVVSALLTAIGSGLGRWLPGGKLFVWAFDLSLSFVVVTLLFAMLFKFLPDTRLEWNDVWVGAAVTSAMFSIGKYLIGLYLGKSGVASAYGAMGSIIVLIVWVYYSAQILFMGAEFTKVYAGKYGSQLSRHSGSQNLPT